MGLLVRRIYKGRVMLSLSTILYLRFILKFSLSKSLDRYSVGRGDI